MITDWILSKHCRLTIYLWVSLSILDFLNQQENFATSVACVIKLTRVAKTAFIHKILCFEVFKILFGQLVDRMLENKSRQERDAPPLPHLPGESPSGAYILALLVKNGPLPAELKFRENTEH